MNRANRTGMLLGLAFLAHVAPRRGEAPDRSDRGRARQRDEVAALRAPRVPHRRRGLDRAGGLGQRAAGHHRHQPLLRAHDVQGHEDHRHQGHRRRLEAHRGAGEGARGDARGDGQDARDACGGARSTTSRSRRTGPRATASSRSSSRPSSRSSARPSIKDHLDQIYTKNGGESLNAFTNEDQTAYFIRLPSNRLELWAWLESDRLLNPVFREFYSERDVVFEERRMRTESTPLGKYDEAFNAALLGGPSLPLAGGGLALRHPDVHPGPGQGLLRDLLRAQQPHRGPGGRLQDRRGQAAARALLRPHPPGQDRPAAGGDPRAEVRWARSAIYA